MQTVNLVADVDARLISTGARFPRCYEVGRPVAAGLRRKVPRPRPLDCQLSDAFEFIALARDLST
jgi:hypothetical protein